ncbi:hypothetical protein ACF07Y_38750 [Streptomyces sp. NPDC016566]|uniref:hypothetical protein n=1 Tax=Streptomyces sp. NPDC016566 TaxID=3364967 RepID=UPI0036F8ED85
MPKKQSTAAKRARAAVRSSGGKYTAALREAASHHLPSHLELFNDQAVPEGERMVVDCLRALAAEDEPLPVRLAEPDPEVVEALARGDEKGRSRLWRRWASVEAAVDGYVLRESQYGSNRSGCGAAPTGPVPLTLDLDRHRRTRP